jgi:glycosyltransferase involved in cell wall biosynthesis
MITYNHEHFIAEAIQGVLMQKTNFPIKLIIGEDCSTDKTRNICKDFQQQNPELIELLPSLNNLGMMPNFIRTLEGCTGNYVALCEGDDYWTDPLKLQKQVDFLEANEAYAISFHNSTVYNNHGNTGKLLLKTPSSYTTHDIFRSKIIPTQTVVFRNPKTNFPTIFSKVYNGDTFLFCWLANLYQKGAYFQNDLAPSVYRHHETGNWSAISLKNKYFHSLHTMKALYNTFPKYREDLLFRIQQMQLEYNSLVKEKNKQIHFAFEVAKFAFQKFKFGFGRLIIRRVL